MYLRSSAEPITLTKLLCTVNKSSGQVWLCKTLQLTATHCNTLQHTATHCTTLQLFGTVKAPDRCDCVCVCVREREWEKEGQKVVNAWVREKVLCMRECVRVRVRVRVRLYAHVRARVHLRAFECICVSLIAGVGVCVEYVICKMHMLYVKCTLHHTSSWWVLSHLSHASFETCLIWVMSHLSHVLFESCRTYEWPLSLCARPHVTFTRVTWLTYVYEMPYLHAWRD